MVVLDKIGPDDALIEALPIAVAVFGEDGRLHLSNKAYRSLFRLDPAWLDGHPSHSDILNRLREARRWPEINDFKSYRTSEAARLKGLEKPESDQLYLPDGTVLRRIAAPLKDGFMLSFEDLSPRLEAERARNESTAVQRQTLDHIGVAIAVYGADGRQRLCNTAFQALWNLPDDEPALGNFLDASRAYLAAGDDWPVKRGQLTTRLLGRQAGLSRLTRNDGLVLDGAHIPLPDGAALLSYTDVTDGAGLEDALRGRAAAMQDANRMKSDFLATLSHQVRNPLTAITGFAEMLVGGYVGALNKRQAEYAAGIASQSDALAAMFDAVLDLAGMEAGLESDMECETIDLHAALAEAFAMIRERARAKKITLNFDCSPDIGWLEADAKKLRHSISHLLGNALSHTAGGGQVSLAASQKQGWFEISVADTGAGMKRRDIARMRQPFERGEATEPGAGLGLTLVDAFVRLQGGEMKITSAPSRGTRVTCRLPATPETGD